MTLLSFSWLLGNVEIGNGYGVPGGGAYYSISSGFQPGTTQSNTYCIWSYFCRIFLFLFLLLFFFSFFF